MKANNQRQSNKKLMFLLLLIGVCMLVPGCVQHYAVLISTHEVLSDDIAYYSEFWYDLFLQYKMLRELGYKDENIFILYGTGSDFGTGHTDYNANTVYGHTITDLACNKIQIQDIFSTLAGKMDNDDSLYVWWMGHGTNEPPHGGPGTCDLAMSISHTGEYVTDVEFANYLNNITSYGIRWINVMTCHSGGLIDNLNVTGNKTVAFTSCTCKELSFDEPNSCDIFHAEFNYEEPTAYRQLNPCSMAVSSDTNGDGRITATEAFNYIKKNVVTSTPQKADPDNIASKVAVLVE